MGCSTTSMHDALGNPFMVEVRDLLTQVEILQQRWSALARLERVLIVIDSEALIRCEIFLRGILLEHREIFVLLSLFVLFPFCHVDTLHLLLLVASALSLIPPQLLHIPPADEPIDPNWVRYGSASSLQTDPD